MYFEWHMIYNFPNKGFSLMLKTILAKWASLQALNCSMNWFLSTDKSFMWSSLPHGASFPKQQLWLVDWLAGCPLKCPFQHYWVRPNVGGEKYALGPGSTKHLLIDLVNWPYPIIWQIEKVIMQYSSMKKTTKVVQNTLYSVYTNKLSSTVCYSNSRVATGEVSWLDTGV